MTGRPGERTSVDAQSVALVVRACPLVVGMHAGPWDRIATGVGLSRIVGVRVQDGNLVLGVIGRDGATTDDVATQVRATLADRVPGFQVTVSVRNVSEVWDRPTPDARSADPADR